MDRYLNRQEAGRILADALLQYANRKDVIVLALPRGGVPVAYEIAKTLHVPLDVFIVRKIGVPGHSELAMGALAMGDVKVFNDDILRELAISPEDVQDVIRNEERELKRREMLYRGTHVFPSLKNKTVILVDDGIATGATMRAAIKALRQLQPDSIIVAVPVADSGLLQTLQGIPDKIICPMQPPFLQAVGLWYVDFSQTEDEEVLSLLNAAKKVNATNL